MSTMTEEGTGTDLWEFDEPSLLCEIIPPPGTDKCGKQAAFTLQCRCSRCGHISALLFVCKDCHAAITAPGWRIACNTCHSSTPMAQDWKPL
jgi:hypothetical protein